MLLRIAVAAALVLAGAAIAAPAASAHSHCVAGDVTVQEDCRDDVGYCNYWLSVAGDGACLLRAEGVA